jgi:DNA-binding PadR family transcriptional regulator
MHGYQLIQTITERTGGHWSPSPGAIYPTLSQLEDEGLVSIQKEGGRKLAHLTDDGSTYVAEHKDSWNDPFLSASEQEQLPDVLGAMHDLGGAVREAARNANGRQLERIAELLGRTKRGVYRILADDDPGASEDEPTPSDTGGNPTPSDDDAPASPDHGTDRSEH